MRYEMFKSLITAESKKQNMRKLTTSRKPQVQDPQQKSCPTKSETTAVHEIGVKDFLVRSNVFKCMHNDHVIENVSAMISIDTRLVVFSILVVRNVMDRQRLRHALILTILTI